MMQFFNYVYYRTRKLYERFKSERGMSNISAAFVPGALQGFNLLTLPLLFELASGVTIYELGLEDYHFPVIGLLLIWLNYRRYNGDKVFTLRRLWNSEHKGLRRKRGAKVIAYIVLSFCSFFGVAGILGEINQGRW